MLASEIRAAFFEWYARQRVANALEYFPLGSEQRAFEAGARWALTQLLKHCPQTYEPRHDGPEVEYLEYREFKQLCEVEED